VHNVDVRHLKVQETNKQQAKKVKSDAEYFTEWTEKYGEEGAKVIRDTVKANVEDYEYLKQFAIKVPARK
jgi:hypothetical protein